MTIPARLQAAQLGGSLRDRLLPVCNDHQSIAGAKNNIVRSNQIALPLADHGHLDTNRQILGEFVDGAAGTVFAQGDLAHVEALGFGREFRLDQLRHKIDAEDRADHTKRIGNRISDRRFLVAHDVERRLKRRGARHRTGKDAECVSDLDSECLSKPERDHKTGDDTDQSQQVVLATCRAHHAFEELPAV